MDPLCPLQFSAIEPVFAVLGRSFETKKQATLMSIVNALPWFTYRRGFELLPHSTLTADGGWGCIMRSGQMLLALALLAAHEPSHVFRWSKEEHLRTLKLFADEASAPYSMHKIVSVGVTIGKKVGEWYGPTTIASVMRDLVNNRTGEKLRAYVSRDSGIYLPDVVPMLQKGPVLLLLPMRLGSGSSVARDYVPLVQALFESKNCVGIIGGRPSASFFFFAAQSGDVFYLDPHEAQQVATNLHTATDVPKSYICSTPQQMRIADLDPCMTAGFLLHNEAELNELRDFWKKHGLTAITSFVEASLSRSADILAVNDFDEL